MIKNNKKQDKRIDLKIDKNKNIVIKEKNSIKNW